MSEHQVNIVNKGPDDVKVELDGKDITDALVGVDVSFRPEALPAVRLDLLVMNMLTLDCGSTTVEIPDETAKLLVESIGWTPPQQS